MNDKTADVHDRQLVKFLESWAGCDGGNAKAPLWICGIEHGGEFDGEGPLVPEPEPGYWDERFRQEHKEFHTWQYHQKVAKLLVALRKVRSVSSTTSSFEGWREYLKHDLYGKNGDACKLNLFPLSSPAVLTEGWKEAYSSATNIKNKDDYYDLYRRYRFDFLAKQRHAFSPKIIIGTGITYQDDFAKAFGFESITREPLVLAANGGQRRDCWCYRDNTGTLIVTPFFGGRHGINSDALLLDLARQVALRLPIL